MKHPCRNRLLYILFALFAAPLSTFAQTFPFDPVTGVFGPMVGFNLGNMGIAVGSQQFPEIAGELSIFYQGQSLGGFLSGPVTPVSGLYFPDGLATTVIDNVEKVGDSIQVAGTQSDIPFVTTYKILPDADTLEVSTTWPEVTREGLAFNQIAIDGAFNYDRVPTIKDGSPSFAGIIDRARNYPEFSVVAGSDQSSSQVYSVASNSGSGLPPIALREELTTPSTLGYSSIDLDGGGPSRFAGFAGMVGAAKVLEPSTEPQTLTTTFSFGRSPTEAFDSFSTLTGESLPSFSTESRVSMGGANALGAERNPSALYFPPQVKAAAFLPELGEGFFVVAANPFAIPIVNASGHAAWTSDNFDLARNGGLFFDFDLNRLDLQIKIGDISLTYFVNERFEMRFRDLVVRVAGEDINLDSFLFSSRNPAILSPDQISLVAGTCEIIPLSRSSDHAPVAFRDFSIDPLVSFQPAGSFYKSTVFVVEVDLFYPENLVLGLLLQPSFRPFDNFPALLLDQRSASPGAIYVGVPEASSEVMCGSGLLIAALVTINRLRAKRTN